MGLLIMLAIVAFVIWGGFSLVRTAGERRDAEALPPAKGSSAMEVLRERYARGEIDRETFERMREDLRV